MHIYEEYVVVDAAGRLQIPPDLREELGIGNRVTLEKVEGGVIIWPAAGVQPIISPDREDSDEWEVEQVPKRHRGLAGWLGRGRREG
jgi:bifunctional DNA-binding transcriptional regulator/antitoxin component of YhaV-PrlF toxin-antitoxin module